MASKLLHIGARDIDERTAYLITAKRFDYPQSTLIWIHGSETDPHLRISVHEQSSLDKAQNYNRLHGQSPPPNEPTAYQLQLSFHILEIMCQDRLPN